MTTDLPDMGHYVRCPDFTRITPHTEEAASYRADRLRDSDPRQIVPDFVLVLKAHLVVRTAYELHDPVAHPADMGMFVRDVAVLSRWYGIPPEAVAGWLRLRAEALAAAWAREAVAS